LENSAQTFLNERISSRVKDLVAPVIWKTYEKFSTTTPVTYQHPSSVKKMRLTSEHVGKDILLVTKCNDGRSQ
jgi:hypothetical protein